MIRLLHPFNWLLLNHLGRLLLLPGVALYQHERVAHLLCHVLGVGALETESLLDVLFALHNVVEVGEGLEVEAAVGLDERVADDLLSQLLLLLNDCLQLPVEVVDALRCLRVKLAELLTGSNCCTICYVTQTLVGAVGAAAVH